MPCPTPARAALLISIGLLAAGSCGKVAVAAEQRDLASRAVPSSVGSADLRAAVSDPRVKRFYEQRDWQPAWTGENAARLSSALDQADRHGLRRSLFLGDGEAAEDEAAREVAMTRAALDFAEALATGRTDPEDIRDIYTISRPETDVVAGLGQAVRQGRVEDWLIGLAPQDAAYRTLSDAYLKYSRLEAQATGSKIENDGVIREGDSDPRVPAIRRLLADRGYLQDATSVDDAQTYTREIAEAIAHLQNDFGIASDGVTGPDTFDALNTGPAERARQLAVNLERMRWLVRQPPETRIDVNIASASLDYWRDGARIDQRRVVVGQPGWETPQLGSPIFRLVANPSWTVPKSIERKELANKSDAYLSQNNMERRNGWIVQLPGPDNALGEVKFDMRNRHAIYLHDTPSKPLFEQNDRHRSHGCVRVEDALGFARMLAEADGKLDRFEAALATGEETFVALDRNVPVRLVYHSAFVDRDGAVRFRPDRYGWDEDVAKALGLDPGERRSSKSKKDGDVGP